MPGATSLIFKNPMWGGCGLDWGFDVVGRWQLGDRLEVRLCLLACLPICLRVGVCVCGCVCVCVLLACLFVCVFLFVFELCVWFLLDLCVCVYVSYLVFHVVSLFLWLPACLSGRQLSCVHWAFRLVPCEKF